MKAQQMKLPLWCKSCPKSTRQIKPPLRLHFDVYVWVLINWMFGNWTLLNGKNLKVFRQLNKVLIIKCLIVLAWLDVLVCFFVFDCCTLLHVGAESKIVKHFLEQSLQHISDCWRCWIMREFRSLLRCSQTHTMRWLCNEYNLSF